MSNSIKIDVPFIIDENINVEMFTAEDAKNNFNNGKDKINYKRVNKKLKQIINKIKKESNKKSEINVNLLQTFFRLNNKEIGCIASTLETLGYDVKIIVNERYYMNVSWHNKYKN